MKYTPWSIPLTLTRILFLLLILVHPPLLVYLTPLYHATFDSYESNVIR